MSKMPNYRRIAVGAIVLLLLFFALGVLDDRSTPAMRGKTIEQTLECEAQTEHNENGVIVRKTWRLRWIQREGYNENECVGKKNGTLRIFSTMILSILLRHPTLILKLVLFVGLVNL